MDKIKENIITDIKTAISVFAQIRKQRKNKSGGKAGRVKEFPFLVSGGFYNTVEGCTLSWCGKDVRDQAEKVFDGLPDEIRHSLQWTPKKGEFITRAKLWKSILKPSMPPQQYHMAMGRILHWYVHIKQNHRKDR